MLTKEEYHEYLNVICDNWKDNSSEGCQMYDTICDAFEQLIQEHFDNPPLSFDELEKGMWVWDDKEKWFRKIAILFEPCGYAPLGSLKCWTNSVKIDLDFIEFGQNRFYRKQVGNNA